jgi:transcriptional regulator with XRE-family HTH domain
MQTADRQVISKSKGKTKRSHKPTEGETMQQLDARLVSERLREVVADEPKAFAYDIGVSLSAVYNYLNGRIPTTEVLFRISRHTGRPMEWFLNDPQANDLSELDRNERRSQGMDQGMAIAV